MDLRAWRILVSLKFYKQHNKVRLRALEGRLGSSKKPFKGPRSYWQEQQWFFFKKMQIYKIEKKEACKKDKIELEEWPDLHNNFKYCNH